jgi:DNA-binding Lrp family transcriptional regulator
LKFAKTIDSIDEIIVKELLKDARKNFSEIAKTAAVSKTAITNRYAELERKGVIKGATVQIDYRTFGFDNVASLFIKAAKTQLKDVEEYIHKIPLITSPRLSVYGVFRVHDPEYNIKVVTTLHNTKELEQVKSIIRHHPAIFDIKTNVWTEVINIPENLDIAKKERITVYGKKQGQKANRYCKIDETDIRIVEEMSINSRESFRNIAQKLGLSTDTVARRYQKLVESGNMKATIQIDPTKLGYNATALFNLAFSSGEVNLTIDEILNKVPDITLIIRGSGEFDAAVTIMIKNISQLLAAQSELENMPSVVRLKMQIGQVPTTWISRRQYISTV